MTKTAWMFPGQGSQKIGMGQDLQSIPAAEAKFIAAEEILGWSVLEMCQGDEETLARTLYTQPCLYVVEAILVDLLQAKTGSPDLVAGHSLGEYVALYAAGVFDFATGLKLVKKRAELMEGAAGGKMAALMKFDRTELTTALNEVSDVVLANDNSEGQVVISGTPEGVTSIMERVKAKRALPLNVSGAFHSPLMAEAGEQFLTVLEAVEFQDARIPVISNVDPTPTSDRQKLKQRLAEQMTNSVRWREIMEQLSELGVTQAIEVGPGKVLSGLLKRTCKEIEITTVGTVSQFNDVVATASVS